MAINFNLLDLYRKTLTDYSRSAAVSGTLKLAHLTAITPNQNTDQYVSDFVANEVSGTGYSRLALATPTHTMDASGNITFDADDPAQIAQSGAGFSNGRRVLIEFDTGTDSTSSVVGYSDDAGADYGNVAGTLDVALNASGIWTSAR